MLLILVDSKLLFKFKLKTKHAMRQKTPRACSNLQQDDFVYEGPSSMKKAGSDWTKSEDDRLENLLL